MSDDSAVVVRRIAELLLDEADIGLDRVTSSVDGPLTVADLAALHHDPYGELDRLRTFGAMGGAHRGWSDGTQVVECTLVVYPSATLASTAAVERGMLLDAEGARTYRTTDGEVRLVFDPHLDLFALSTIAVSTPHNISTPDIRVVIEVSVADQLQDLASDLETAPSLESVPAFLNVRELLRRQQHRVEHGARV